MQANAVQKAYVKSKSEPNKEPPGLRANLKRKQRDSASVEEDGDSPRRTRGKHIDYCHLNDPFSNNKDDENVNAATIVNDETFSVATNDGEPSLKEARKSDEWPEWEEA